jgi:hypothetical protein
LRRLRPSLSPETMNDYCGTVPLQHFQPNLLITKELYVKTASTGDHKSCLHLSPVSDPAWVQKDQALNLGNALKLTLNAEKNILLMGFGLSEGCVSAGHRSWGRPSTAVQVEVYRRGYFGDCLFPCQADAFSPQVQSVWGRTH